MIRFLFSILFFCLAALSVFSQDEQTLITIGDTKVSKAEFERIYKKNNSNLYNESDKKSPEEYLDLFINFKLKVIEAEKLKMDTSAAFIKELAGYREELAAPYLTNIHYNDELVNELYNRTTKEVNASHILLNVSRDATPEQDKEILDKILKIRQEIIDGKDFEEAAKEYSQDPSAKTNSGKLGYFTAFQMVTPFENAAFTTPVGQISEPVKTTFGYHLVKVNDIRDNKGEILVAHIMKMFPKDMTAATKQKLKLQIDSIYTELKNGADFAELARTKSDDKRSSTQGGEMPWFGNGRMIPEFANPAFAIKNIGDYTEPIETPYGYHIIKKIAVKPVPSFEEAKEEIVTRIKNDPQRSFRSKQAFIDNLKVEYNYQKNDEGYSKLKDKKIASDLHDENFELFTIDNKKYEMQDFRNYLTKQNASSGSYLSYYQPWEMDAITALEDSKLKDKHPDFKYLLQEYHDGILLFNISEEKIWNFAAQDTVGLEEFYKKNDKKYMWEERFKGTIITCKTVEAREEAEKYFAEEMTNEEVSDMMNKNESLISFTEGAWERGANPIVDYYVWNQPEPANFNSEITFLRGNKIPPEPKKLDEARGLYISDYQKFLEDNWIKELRKKYKITVDKKLLKTIQGV
ncbi:MAG: peptidylprolyl isomerase [Draconibacterium sp.]